MSDCCIIGGGVIGLSLARELAGRGRSVRLLARDQRRDTASWAAAGILPPAPLFPGCSPGEALTAWSDRLHRIWADELRTETGIDTGLEACGGLHVAADDGGLARLADEAATWRSRGAACEWLDADPLAALEPALAGAVDRGAIRGGFLLPGEMQLRPPRHLAALEHSCLARGAVISRAAEAVDFIPQGGRIAAVVATVDGTVETVRADTFVLAAGAWSEAIAAKLGLAIATRPIRGQIALLRLPRQPLGRVVNRGLDYLVPRTDGRLLAGSTIEDAGFDRGTSPDAIERLLEVAADLLGDLPGAVVEQAWAGLRPGSADGLPWIGRCPAFSNTFVAAGHFRAGLHQSTGTAMMLADMIENRAPELDPRPFAPDRPPAGPGSDAVADYIARAAASSMRPAVTRR